MIYSHQAMLFKSPANMSGKTRTSYRSYVKHYDTYCERQGFRGMLVMTSLQAFKWLRQYLRAYIREKSVTNIGDIITALSYRGRCTTGVELSLHQVCPALKTLLKTLRKVHAPEISSPPSGMPIKLEQLVLIHRAAMASRNPRLIRCADILKLGWVSGVRPSMLLYSSDTNTRPLRLRDFALWRHIADKNIMLCAGIPPTKQKTASGGTMLCFWRLSGPMDITAAIQRIQGFDDWESIYDPQFAHRPVARDAFKPNQVLKLSTFRNQLRQLVSLAGIEQSHTKRPHSMRIGMADHLAGLNVFDKGRIGNILLRWSTGEYKMFHHYGYRDPMTIAKRLRTDPTFLKFEY